ncbi:MAG: helix-turn-helix domain-containing protein [Candidatus Dormibacteria bacterium]
MARKSKVIWHTTHGSVLDDLNVSPEGLMAFKLKAELHEVILETASRYSRAELQNILHEPQPRVSDFMRGKITKFSLETLLGYAAQLGMRPQISATGSKNHTHVFEAVVTD